jgi:hypothetical protein
MQRTGRILLFAAVSAILTHGAAVAYDHIVVVIEENKSRNEIIGNTAEAPFINNVLVAGGASMANMFALTDPSQPNYLQFFSGSNQGIADNTVPAPGAPFSTPNLGAALFASGKSFVGYSEDLPEVGSTIEESGAYARRHNPWVNWQVPTPNGNQLPASVNQPFTSFPDATNYAQLPHVSIVVPNNANNMHDGTIGEGDTWLASHLSAYAAWAKTHNSLLVVTFDEDLAGQQGNIPTVLYGANVAVGKTVQSTATLHNLLRTIEDFNGAAHSGSAANLRSIVGPFQSDKPFTIVSFQDGVNGYNGTADTYIPQSDPSASHGSFDTLTVGGNAPDQALVRFSSFVGSAAGRVPQGAQVLSAKLVLTTSESDVAAAEQDVALHTLTVQVGSTSTWNSLGNGISIGSEANATPEFTLFPNILGNRAIFDVTASVQAIVDGASNFGWVVNSVGAGHWRAESSESASVDLRPRLEVTFAGALRGDFDGDGVLGKGDLPAMLRALTDLNAYRTQHGDLSLSDLLALGDFDNDGSVTNRDIQPLLNLLAANNIAGVPEPGSLAIALLAGLGATAFRGRRQRQISISS